MKIKLISLFTSFALVLSFLAPSITFAKESKTTVKSLAVESEYTFYDDQKENVEALAIEDDIDWDSIPNEVMEDNVAQPFVWGLVARLVLSGGKYVIKWGSKVFKKAPKSKVTNALASFKTATYKTGSHTFKLTKTDMKHMLERHHPQYWDGTVKKTQTFYNPNLSVNDVKNVAMTIAKSNSKTLAKKGTNSTFQVEGSVGGVKYILGISKGHVKQLYPK